MRTHVGQILGFLASAALGAYIALVASWGQNHEITSLVPYPFTAYPLVAALALGVAAAVLTWPRRSKRYDGPAFTLRVLEDGMTWELLRTAPTAASDVRYGTGSLGVTGAIDRAMIAPNLIGEMKQGDKKWFPPRENQIWLTWLDNGLHYSGSFYRDETIGATEVRAVPPRADGSIQF